MTDVVASTVFARYDAFADPLCLPGLALSHDGTRSVTAVAAPAPDRTRYTTALWRWIRPGSVPRAG